MDGTILVIDDMQWCLDRHTRILSEQGLSIVSASTLKAARTEYDTHREVLVAIILDGCVPGDTVNTFPFIRMVSSDKKFTGILMAASPRVSDRREMLRAGCTHHASRDNAAQEVLRLLESQ